MKIRVTRWLQGETGMSGILEILLLLGLLGGASVGAWFGFGSKEIDKLVEIRPAGAPDMGTETTMAEGFADTARLVQGVSEVKKVLYVSRGEGTMAGPRLVIGSEVPASPLQTFVKVPAVEGRTLGADDAGRNVGVVGKRFAEEYTPVGQPALSSGATVEVGGAPVEVVGIFSSGIPLMDQQMALPLDTAQRLFRLEGRVSGLFVTVKRARDRERVMEALRDALGDTVDVVYPHRHDAHPH